jgi:predicted Kef-type K+ transport protein
MDPIWLSVALLLGFLALQLRLPPLVGYLAAGFVLHGLGVEGGQLIDQASALGVTLLLFTIGLKLRLDSLLRTEVWASAGVHLSLNVVLLTLVFMLLGYAGLTLFDVLQWRTAALIAFALSFSSTVFAVKVLEERGEMKTRHGRIAIGVLIIQDIFAVLFLTLATGKLPSPWALLLLGLPLLRPLIFPLLQRTGHGEVQILFGLVMAIAASSLFEAVGMKGDLGALVAGVLLGSHVKSSELARNLLAFKDIFLVGFFLSIGLNALPGWLDLLMALLLVIVLLPVKTILFHLLFSYLKLRTRTAFLGSLSLANYSEFGLIVAAVGVKAGWLDAHWLMIIALALSLSFIVSSVLNSLAYPLFHKLECYLRRYERSERLPEDQQVNLGEAEVVIIGMGRVGTGAYDAMRSIREDRVCGIDTDMALVEQHRSEGRKVYFGDSEDVDFWSGVDLQVVRLVMLALPTLEDMVHTVEALKAKGYQGRIAAVAKYEDDRQKLLAAGVDEAYNFYAEVGAGFAAHVVQTVCEQKTEEASTAATP